MLLQLLEEIRGLENEYLDCIPDNLQSGVRYEAAQDTVDALDEAISILESAY
jgi:hypothetical protein